MNMAQLKKLIKQGESETVEFKKSTALMRSIFETICAFLNGKGGTVLIGINDKGERVGQDVSDNTRQEIAKELSKIEPPANIDIHYIAIGKNKLVIAIHADANHHAPYIYDGRAFQRHQSTTSKMPQHRYEQLLVTRGSVNHAWDEQAAVDYDIDFLDHQEIRNTIRDGVNGNRIPTEVLTYSIKDTLRYLKLIKNKKILNAAVILYAKEVEPDYSQCLIRMTRYKGTTKLANFMESKHVYGNAFKILSEANYFSMRHLPVASFFESDKFIRIDKPTLPVMAIREALVNAISHRDYTNRSASISFAIFDDRLEIWNNGTLPPELKLKDLKKRHESYPRNKRIAKIFYSRGWVEKAGIGTLRMLEDCKELGVPEPKFEEYSKGFAVIFKFRQLMRISTEKNLPIKEMLNARQKTILEFINREKSASTTQILMKFPGLLSKRTLIRDLNHLKSLGLVGSEGQTRNIVWVSQSKST
jgi:ATP-dependent DNA helicase RecG